MQEVSFSGSRRLSGRIFEPTGGGLSHRAVLFVHGLGSSQRPYASRAEIVSQELAAVCLTFDLSGLGDDRHGGMPSVSDHLADIAAAYDYLAARSNVDATRIGVCGASYGGYLAAVLTAHRSVRRLALRSPILAGDLQWAVAGGALRAAADGVDPDSLEILRRYHGDLLVIEAERDEVVPASHITAYVQTSPRARHFMIPEATHALRDAHWNELFVRAVVQWFEAL